MIRAKQDEGVRGRFLDTKYIEIDLSFDGTFASDGKDVKAREGMPELDHLVEFGPSLIVHLIEKPKKVALDLRLPARLAISSDFTNIRERGTTINPFFNLKLYNLFRDQDMFLFSIGGKWASKKLMDFYYTVEPAYQTSSRQIYSASGGFMELSLSAAIFQPIVNNWWFFTGIVRPYYNDAANLESPLLTKKNTTSIVAGIYWNFHKSEIMVTE